MYLCYQCKRIQFPFRQSNIRYEPEATTAVTIAQSSSSCMSNCLLEALSKIFQVTSYENNKASHQNRGHIPGDICPDTVDIIQDSPCN